MNIILTIVLITLFYVFCNASATVKEDDVRNYLGTRTPYRFRQNVNSHVLKYPNCNDTKIWMLVRHGTRLPSAKDIIGMNTTLQNLKSEILLAHRLYKGQLSNDQIDHLKAWTVKLDPKDEKILTREGQNEMILIAERMHMRFPNAIKDKYDIDSFLFRYTATERAQQSAKYFTVGLFDKKVAESVVFVPATKVDPVLRFYKHCDRWQKQVKKNPDTYKEQNLFGSSQIMNDTLAKVSSRLGLQNTLSLDQVNLMYKICGFESSWNKYYVSPWCDAFDVEDARIFEYYHDLKHYWMDGYGHKITYRQACLAINNMFDSFYDEAGPNASFLFAHSGTLLKVLAHLQLYKPHHHLAGAAVDAGRSWKTSLIDCFASNLAFVLYKCDDGDKVLTLHQERVIKLPMCETELCPLNNITEYFNDSIHFCDYSEMCSLNTTSDKS